MNWDALLPGVYMRKRLIPLCVDCGGFRPLNFIRWGVRPHERRRDRLYCFRCSGRRSMAKIAARKAASQPAHYAVARAIWRGELPRPATLMCVDCGKSAECYDHREYAKPLQVEAVCKRCNILRGPAIDSAADTASHA